MMFLYHRWDMLVPWRVKQITWQHSSCNIDVELVHVSFFWTWWKMTWWTIENRTTVYKSHPMVLAIPLDVTFPEYPCIVHHYTIPTQQNRFIPYTLQTYRSSSISPTYTTTLVSLHSLKLTYPYIFPFSIDLPKNTTKCILQHHFSAWCQFNLPSRADCSPLFWTSFPESRLPGSRHSNALLKRNWFIRNQRDFSHLKVTMFVVLKLLFIGSSFHIMVYPPTFG